MGLFSHLRYTKLERTLLKLYTDDFVGMGMPPTKAKQMVYEMLDDCIQSSKQNGSYYLPLNFGDVILGDAEPQSRSEAKIAEDIKQRLPGKRADGVRDEDIRRWWNLHEVERRMMYKYDDAIRLLMNILREQEGRPTPEAGDLPLHDFMKKSHPIYGYPGDSTSVIGDDRPLPDELRYRIAAYMQSKSREDLDAMSKVVQEMSSFNAFYRKEIRDGTI